MFFLPSFFHFLQLFFSLHFVQIFLLEDIMHTRVSIFFFRLYLWTFTMHIWCIMYDIKLYIYFHIPFRGFSILYDFFFSPSNFFISPFWSYFQFFFLFLLIFGVPFLPKLSKRQKRTSSRKLKEEKTWMTVFFFLFLQIRKLLCRWLWRCNRISVSFLLPSPTMLEC